MQFLYIWHFWASESFSNFSPNYGKTINCWNFSQSNIKCVFYSWLRGKLITDHVNHASIKLSSHEQCFCGNEYLLKKSIFVHTEQRNLLKKNCQWIFTKVTLPYNICSRVHMNDENSPNVTWTNTFVRVNYIFVEVFNAISSLLQIKHVWFWAKFFKF